MFSVRNIRSIYLLVEILKVFYTIYTDEIKRYLKVPFSFHVLSKYRYLEQGQ